MSGLDMPRFEFHIESAVMAKPPLAAIDLQQVLGRLSPNSIIGPACVANDCQHRGFTSQGNNRICDNGINGPASDCGAIAARLAKFGNMQVQMNFNGQDNSASDNFVCAQNNCWGATPVSPATCWPLDYNYNRIGPFLRPERRPERCRLATIAERVADGRMAVFEDNAHLAHREEPDGYLATVVAFLDG